MKMLELLSLMILYFYKRTFSMKTSLFLLLSFLSFSFQPKANGPVLIKEASLLVSFPNDKWEEIKEHRAPKPTYHFIRTGVTVSKEKPMYPEVVITVDQLKNYTDLTQYSLQKQKAFASLKNYKVEKVFTDSDGMLKLQYAVGTKATYKDANDIKHTFYFIHALKQGTGVQVLIDIPSDLFDTYEEELTSIIRSLEYKG